MDPNRLIVLEAEGSYFADWRADLQSSESLGSGRFNERDWEMTRSAYRTVLVTGN